MYDAKEITRMTTVEKASLERVSSWRAINEKYMGGHPQGGLEEEGTLDKCDAGESLSKQYLS